MKRMFSVDRIEGGVAVCIDDDLNVYEFDRSEIGELNEKDVFSAELEDGSLTDIIPLPEERDRRLKVARERLNRLFGKGDPI